MADASPDKDLVELSRRLRMARASANLTQSEAAKRSNVSQSALSLYEKARRQPLAISIKRLAMTYGIATDWLLSLGDEGGPR